MAESNQQPRNLLQKFVEELIDQVDWVRKILSDKQARKAIEEDLGIETGSLKDLPPETTSITAYRQAAREGNSVSKQVSLEVLAEIFSVYESIAAMIEAGSHGGKEAARAIAHNLLSLLLLGYVRLRYPRIHKWGQILGLVEEVGSVNLSERVYFDRVPELLTDVGGYFKQRFGKLTAIPDRILATEQDAKILSDALFPVVATLLALQGNKKENKEHTFLPSFFATKNVIYGWDAAPGSQTQIADAISERTLSMGFEYRKQDDEGGGAVEGELGLTLLLVPQSDGGPGIFLSLTGLAEIEGEINEDWRLKVAPRATGALDFLLGANMAAGGSADASVQVTVEPIPTVAGQPVGTQPTAGQKFIFPDRCGMRVEFGRLSFKGEISQRGAGIEVTAEDGAFIISSDGCDGFVAEVMPGQKVSPGLGNCPPAKETRISFNLGLGLSSERGFYLTSGSGLQAVIPLGKTVGPATIQQILLKLAPATDPKPAQLTAEVSAAMSVKLGPITATVDQIGLRARVPFGKSSNGKWDFSVGFKPPTGVGLKIESSAVTGGGFLFYDADRAQYGGVVQLELSKSNISLKADRFDLHTAAGRRIGLFDDRPRDGRRVHADPAWPRFQADGHRRVAGDQPHIQRRGRRRRH